MRAYGNGILIHTAHKGLDILSHIRIRNNLVHKAPLGTVSRAGIVIVLLSAFIHLVDGWLKWPSSIFLFDQPPLVKWQGVKTGDFRNVRILGLL
jgi:hypothetical protein